MLDQGFRETCAAAAARWDVPALAVGVSVAGSEETVALGCSVDDRFRAASITKPFTATLAARLLDLDAPAGAWPGVTVRHLLSHTSGRDCELPGLERLGDGDDALGRAAELLPSVRAWTEPGVVWSYANTGYWLAGHLAAGAAATSYEAALAALVCAPAALAATDFGEPDLDGWEVRADGGRVQGPTHYPRARRPSGGLVSTVADLLRFGVHQLAEPALAPLREPVAQRPDGAYGLGFAVEEVAGTRVCGHGGSWGGFQTSLLLVPARETVFVGLTNSGVGGQALRAVEDAFLERLLGTGRAPAPTVELAPAQLAALAGTYRQPELGLDVAAAEGGLALRLRDGRGTQDLRARPLAPRLFEVTDGQALGHRFDFALGGEQPAFVRFASRLAERVA